MSTHPSRDIIVEAQLGQSLDGKIAAKNGESAGINGSGGLDYLHALRAVADAVVVGIGTVLADDPLLTVRRVSGRSPVRVIIDPNGRLSADAKCLADDGVPVIRIAPASHEKCRRVEHVSIAAVDGAIPPAAILTALAERGLRRILIEGGADTVSRFLAAGAVDRLHLIVAPLIIGSGKQGIELPDGKGLAGAIRPAVAVKRLPDDDVVFVCDLERRV